MIRVFCIVLAFWGCSDRGAQTRPTRTPTAPPAGELVATGGWLVTASTVKTAAVRLLDTRSADAFAAEHIDGAVHVDWLAFSNDHGDAERGKLHADNARLEGVLHSLGVRADLPVRVIGDPVDGWGEDGRIVWTLRTLGHSDVALIDGGHLAMKAAGAAVTSAAPTMPPGDFSITRDSTWDIDTATLLQQVQAEAAKKGEVVFVDARELREYEGETPYGEARGGHLPGAVHLHYRSLLNSGGFLKSRLAVQAILKEKGITADKPIIVYCTGGVRSAWFVAVLKDLGYADARNYAGSMWAWAAGQPGIFLLE